MAQPTNTQPVEQAAAPGDKAPAAEEHPTTVWVCENAQCRYFGKKRRVRWQHLGGGLYLVGTVRCFCGYLPVREPKQR